MYGYVTGPAQAGAVHPGLVYVPHAILSQSAHMLQYMHRPQPMQYMHQPQPMQYTH